MRIARIEARYIRIVPRIRIILFLFEWLFRIAARRGDLCAMKKMKIGNSSIERTFGK